MQIEALAQRLAKGRRRVEARDHVEGPALGVEHEVGAVARDRPLELAPVAEVDRDARGRPLARPMQHEVGVEPASQLGVGVEHGAKESAVGAGELGGQLAEQAQRQDRLAEPRGLALGLAEITLPVEPAKVRVALLGDGVDQGPPVAVGLAMPSRGRDLGPMPRDQVIERGRSKARAQLLGALGDRLGLGQRMVDQAVELELGEVVLGHDFGPRVARARLGALVRAGAGRGARTAEQAGAGQDRGEADAPRSAGSAGARAAREAREGSFRPTRHAANMPEPSGQSW